MPSESLYLSSGGVTKAVLDCAHRTARVILNDPSKLACVPALGRAPMLVYVRPSSEALLRARVPGAQDQCGCASSPFYRVRSASERGITATPIPLSLSAPVQAGACWHTSWRRWARQSCRWKMGLRSEQRQNNELREKG